MSEGKIIIVSAPSGCGKSTIINALMARGDIDMQFSVSATNRPPREGEVDGVNYHFLSDEEFRLEISNDAFIEYEEVYPGRFYGTLKREVERVCGQGHNIVLDIDVKGGINVKKMYGDRALSVFIVPPAVETLRRRLESRATDDKAAIDCRVAKAEYELSFSPMYDCRIVNDNLDEAVENVHDVIVKFIGEV